MAVWDNVPLNLEGGGREEADYLPPLSQFISEAEMFSPSSDWDQLVTLLMITELTSYPGPLFVPSH